MAVKAQTPGFQWSVTIGGTNSGGGYGRVATDAEGSCFTVGGLEWRAFVAKFDQASTLRWMWQPSGSNSGHLNSVAVDDFGNCYAAGAWYGQVLVGGTNFTGVGVIVAKFDNSGVLQWLSRPFLNSVTNNDPDAVGIGVDAQANCYVAGYFTGSLNFGSTNLISSGDVNLFLAKYDSLGNLQSVIREGSAGPSYSYTIPRALAVDRAGNCYISGESNARDRLGGGIFVAKYNNSGAFQWAQFGEGFNGGAHYGYGVAADSSGNCYATGTFYADGTFGTSTVHSPFLAKYSPGGGLIWIKSQATGAGADVAIDLSNALYSAAGAESGSGDAPRVAKYDASGAEEWNIPGIGRIAGIAIDPEGSVYVSGPIYAPEYGSYLGRITGGPSSAPSIIYHPRSVSITAGGVASFGTRARGSLPLHFQWFRDGVPVTGANSPWLVISNAQPTDNGGYSVLVTNTLGAATSVVASLSVSTNFVAPVLTVAIQGQGSVIKSPNKVLYALGEEVTLTATASRWFEFTRWADGATTNPRVITIGPSNGYTAIFSPTTAVETLTFSNISRTAPVGMPAVFVDGKFVTGGALTRLDRSELSILTTFPNGSIFYTLDGSAPDFANLYGGPFVLSRSAIIRAVAYDAAFVRSWEADPVRVIIEPTFEVSATTAGGGTVGISPAASSYRSNTLVTLTASAMPGWTFLQWLGDVPGTTATTSVRVMTRDLCVQALFGTTLSTTTAGAGSVTVDPAVPLYPYGATARLTGVPQAGSYFGAWGNATASTNNPLLFTVTNANPTVSCAFGTLSPGQAALTLLVSGRGRVTTSPHGHRFANSQSVILTAFADSGQEFLGWSGDASGTSTNLSVSMTQSTVIEAHFTARPRLSLGPCLGGWRKDAFQLTLTGEMGGYYLLERSTNTTDWIAAATLTNWFGTTQVTDALATNQTQQFYRAKSEPR